MFSYKFTFLVFQQGKLDEELDTVITFESHEGLMAALIAHAALQSAERFSPLVSVLYNSGNVPMPGPVRQGLGPATVLVIKSIVEI